MSPSRSRRVCRSPRLAILVNKTPSSCDPEVVQRHVEDAYGCRVVAVLPHCDEMMSLASGGVFALRYPEHPITTQYKRVAAALVA